jgi:hypothetical protein
VDDNWFLGSGTYGPAAIKPPSKAQVRAFVGEAVEYARKHGKKKAIAEFMDTGGRFFRGELYVFAYNYAGKVLCLPAEPQKVGEDRWDLQDPDGAYVNPAQSYQVQQKTSYVRRVDGTWLLGAGTYRPAD